MATINTLIKRFKEIDTNAIAFDTMFETKEVAAELNADQINKGLRSDNTVMPDYSKASVLFYGKQPGPIRLRETGAFQAGFFVTIQGDKVVFDSTDEKRDMLIEGEGDREGYGIEVFGLNSEYKKEYIDEAVRLVFKSKIETATGLKYKSGGLPSFIIAFV